MGVDPGLIQTGFGIISVKDNQRTLIDYGIIKPSPKDNLSNRLLTIFNDVCKIITDFAPQVFAIEDIFYGKNIKSAFYLGQARGVVMMCAAKHDMPVFEYSAKKVKQAITGNGNADKTQLQYMPKQIFKLKELPAPLDASDAIGIALCHIYQSKINEL